MPSFNRYVVALQTKVLFWLLKAFYFPIFPMFTFDLGSSASSSARSHSPPTIDDSSDAENDSVDFEDLKGKTAFD